MPYIGDVTPSSRPRHKMTLYSENAPAVFGVAETVDTTKMREAVPKSLQDIFESVHSGPAIMEAAERLNASEPRPNTMFEELQHLAALMGHMAAQVDDMAVKMFGMPVTLSSGPNLNPPDETQPSMAESVNRLANQTRYDIAKTMKGLAQMREFIGN